MSAVDVLAVLRRHAALAEEVASAEQIGEAREVLAAVAELIEALHEKREADNDRRPDGLRNAGMDVRSIHAEQRLEAALARVGGAA